MNFEVEQGKKYQAEITEKKNNIKNLEDVIKGVEEERKKETELQYRLKGQKERYQKAPQVNLSKIMKTNISLLDFQIY